MATDNDNTAAVEQQTFSAADLAERWGIHLNTVWDMLNRGELASFRVGRQKLYRVTLAEVLRYESGERQKTEDS